MPRSGGLSLPPLQRRGEQLCGDLADIGVALGGETLEALVDAERQHQLPPHATLSLRLVAESLLPLCRCHGHGCSLLLQYVTGSTVLDYCQTLSKSFTG